MKREQLASPPQSSSGPTVDFDEIRKQQSGAEYPHLRARYKHCRSLACDTRIGTGLSRSRHLPALVPKEEHCRSLACDTRIGTGLSRSRHLPALVPKEESFSFRPPSHRLMLTLPSRRAFPPSRLGDAAVLPSSDRPSDKACSHIAWMLPFKSGASDVGSPVGNGPSSSLRGGRAQAQAPGE
jgi:hypothetical protein